MTEDHTPNRQDVPIAVIGMGCLFPKAPGLKEYWRLIARGQDAIDEVPGTHWSPADYFHPDPKRPDHVYCTRGGYLTPVSFDPTEFGIPPASIEATDTSQLLGLLAARIALEDAGYGNDREFNREKTSVILGITGTQELVIPLGARLGHPIWRRALAASGISPEKTAEVIERIADGYVPWQENSFPGLLGNVVAGRISNRLNLGGTNCVVDAACASSMSAMHMAVMELKTGRSEMVLTGGVDTLNDIFMHMCFSKTPILSPTGDVRPFSSGADGSILGEGVGLLVFKRLSDALRDGDRVYAVIKGLGTGSDGRSSSIYAPRPEGQMKALRSAYREAGVSPGTVELIEAHGTGTRVGDEVEFSALRQVFTQDSEGGGDRGNWCAIGTVKSMIGHTKAAAGAAGVIKAVLSLYHRVLPPTLKADEPDPRLNIDESPFYLSTSVRPWLSNGRHPRRAGVSSFGFGGSNFHMVLEESPAEERGVAWDGSVEIFALSGSTREEIAQRLSGFQGDVGGMAEEEISALAAQSRAEFSVGSPHRLLLVIEKTLDRFDNLAGVFSEALDALKHNVKETIWNVQNIFYGGPAGDFGKLAFVFPGQGSQYVGMGRDLVCRFPEAMKVMEMANTAVGMVGWLGDRVYPRPGRSAADREAQEDRLRRTEAAQPAIGAVSLAMAKILQRFGLMPDSVCGHSFGELTALCAAGWIDGKTFLELAFIRGKLMGAAGEAGAGAMAAVKAPLEEIDRLIRERNLDVILANRNTPEQGVISGAVAAVEEAEEVCRVLGIPTRRLPVSAAFHSPLMEAAQAPFAEAVGRIQIHPTGTHVFSNATGGAYPADPHHAGKLLAEQILSPVDFVREIKTLWDAGVRTFVEVGPKSVLSGLIRQILKGLHVNALPMDASSGKRFGIVDLARLICHLAVLGHAVALDQWEEKAPRRRKQRMSIPLSGANYRSPSKKRPPPQAGETPPVFERTAAAETRIIVNADTQQAPPDQHPPAKAAPARYGPDTTRAGNEKLMNPKKEDRPPVPRHPIGGYLSDAFRVVQEGLRSMQALQMQTAETHKRFLETQSQANRTIQEMMESTRHLAEASLRGVPAEGTHPVASLLQAAPAVQPSLPPASPPPPAVLVPLRPLPAATPEPATAPDPLPLPASEPAPAPVGSGENAVEAAMLSVVSDLTGYPVEMISLDMDIEADLGIDSIKRVEILSAFEERMPHLPQISPEVMGSMKTLGQIVRHLFGAGPAGDAPRQAAPPPSSAVEPPAADAPEHEAPADTGRIDEALLSVVSDLTGYPVEMISLDMDIEADLGIDSIKRVEILSAFEERMPHLPPVSPEMMGSMKTLGQIVGVLAGAAGAASAVEILSAAPAVEAAAVIHAAAGASGDTSSIEAALLSVVSDLTGYPAEMILPDMDIEADLGIDSIKRVEILSAFEERMPHLPPVSPEIMGTLKTLGQIAAHLRGGGGPSGASAPFDGIPVAEMSGPECAPVEAGPSDAEGEAGDGRTGIVRVEKNTVVPVPNPFEPGVRITIPQGRPVFITEDGPGLGKAISAAMEAMGVMTVVAPPGELLEWKEAYPAGGLVILSDAWESRDGRFLGEAFSLAHGLGPDLAASGALGGALFATVSRLDGAFGFKGRGLADPFQGGLAGLSKTAAVEWPAVTCRALDIAPGWDDIAGIADATVRDLLQAGPVEVGLDREERWTLSLAPAAYPEGDLNLDPGDVVVATGGARGVTAACLCALAEQVPLTLVLLGRSPLPEPEPEWLASLTEPADMKRAIMEHQWPEGRPTPPQLEAAYRGYLNGREIAHNLRRLAAAGATVRYESVDVRDPASVNRVLDAVRSEYGPVKALIHGAGVLEDRLIVDKTPEQFARVFETKAESLEVLLNALKDEPLSYLILFSSVAARMGNRGQADYAMANEVLNKTAQKTALARPVCRVVSFNWGPWDGGMVSPELRREFARSGVTLIPMDAGARSMVAEMAGKPGAPVEIVLGGGLTPAAPAVEAVPEEEAREAAGIKAAPEGACEAPVAAEVPPPAAMDLLFKREVDIERFPVVESNLMDGRPVFPFALMTEWLGHGALHGNPGLYLHGLDDVRLVRRIQVGEEYKLIRLMAGKARRNGAVYEVDVELRNGVKENEEVIHSRARAILTETPHQEPPFFSPPPDIRVKSYARSTDEIYETILPLGEELRGIREIMSCSPKGIIARIISAPPPDRWMAEPLRSRWIGDPLVLDSAFQMVTVWAHEQKGMLSLPNYGAAYRQYRAGFPENGVTAVFEVTGAGDDRVTGNFTFLDAGNEVVAQLLGYEAVMVQPSNGPS